MKIGVIGLGDTGQEVVARLLRRTCHDLYVYDPDHKACQKSVYYCETAAEVCDTCGVLFLALSSASDELALFNGVSSFFHPGSIIVDFTPLSPAQAHQNGNAFRRVRIGYLDCGIFAPNEQLTEHFLCFVGGNGKIFSRIYPLLRCIAPNCRHMGPAGRGQATRILCLSLAANLQHQIEQSVQLAETMGIGRDYFLDCIGGFDEIARPFAAISGNEPAFPLEELRQGEQIAGEMIQRAQKYQAKN